MDTIRAKVNPRLLSKAERLFTGALDGRIMEILQNARRAGATEVHIVNQDGRVTVRDNGRGIADFSALLDLGRSGWDESLDQVEDPAGVGIFCLAPREVQIRSGTRTVVIAGKGWTGKAVEVQTADESIQGTQFAFEDTPWLFENVERHAVFTGLKVTVDGRLCVSEPFVSSGVAAPHSELGCRIEVRECDALSRWHSNWKHNHYTEDVLVNFHGQVVLWTYTPVSEHLQFLVDLTGEPTGIRLMLPARTCLVENEAFERLKAVLEIEAYRYIQKRGSHKLKFSEYRRAKELGIELPEAQPVYQVGLLSDEPIEPVQVVKPPDLPLEKCYRLAPACRDADDPNEANAHLLSALGKFKSPFVVVDISPIYDGYSWATLPVVERARLKAGKELAREPMCSETLIAVESLQIIAHTSDGRVYCSAVPMAVRRHPQTAKRRSWCTVEILVTLEARERLDASDIWYHLGGYSEDGDTYGTQLADFEEQLNLFWAGILGPGEYMRQRLLECIEDFGIQWKQITVESSGKVWISYKDGSAQMLQPPELSAVQ
ncbi:MAG: hypothetical protein KBE65_17715 [Phycisphaerae bacterium]|nr:hypothetical protein [Phycisphaerae bacterium]